MIWFSLQLSHSLGLILSGQQAVHRHQVSLWQPECLQSCLEPDYRKPEHYYLLSVQRWVQWPAELFSYQKVCQKAPVYIGARLSPFQEQRQSALWHRTADRRFDRWNCQKPTGTMIQGWQMNTASSVLSTALEATRHQCLKKLTSVSATSFLRSSQIIPKVLLCSLSIGSDCREKLYGI